MFTQAKLTGRTRRLGLGLLGFFQEVVTPPQPVATLAFKECSFATFKDLAHTSANLGVLERAGFVVDLGQTSARPAGRTGHDDLIGIGVHNKVRVVCHDDDLAAFARVAEVRHELLEDGIRVEVFLRLVHDEGTLVMQVDGQVEQQQDDAASAR